MNTTSIASPTADTSSVGRRMLNKVPEITLYFWIIKVLCTTVGETAADYLNTNLGFGLSGTSYVMSAVLIVALGFQFATRRYRPGIYWLAVVLISVVGTLITDNLVDTYGVPLQTTTTIFGIALIVTFAIWYASERTLSIHTIYTTRREAFYWLAVLFTFALGTAAGDFLSEKLALGYLNALLLFAGAIAVVAVAHFVFRMNAILSFWLAYILTRPLGASIGDYMAQAKADGGLGLGTTVTSYIFLATILALVVYLAMTRVDVIPTPGRGAPADASGLPRILVVANQPEATPALLEAVKARASAAPVSFFVLVPNPDHPAFDRNTPDHPRGDELLAQVLPAVASSAGVQVEGRVANNPNAYDDIVEELEGSGYDEIILEAPRHSHVSHWLHIDLMHRIKHLGVPVSMVPATA